MYVLFLDQIRIVLNKPRTHLVISFVLGILTCIGYSSFINMFYLGSFISLKWPVYLLAPSNLDLSDVNPVESLFAKEIKPIYYSPSRIRIASIGILASVVSLGVDNQGVMETPVNWAQAGWYKKSSLVGEPGNVIINAHYDDNYGRPAAFWQLKNVKVGDTVSLTDSFGKVFTYQVSDVSFVGINDPERLKVLESNSDNQSVLTLITCGGVYLPQRSSYNQRLVVKAILIKND